MIRIACCALALLVPADLAAADPKGPDPAQGGSQESVPRRPSAGLTMEMLNGLPRTRDAWPYRGPVYQSYPYYSGGYPSFSFNSAYSYPHPFGLGGYYPPGAGGYGGWGWGGWGGWYW